MLQKKCRLKFCKMSNLTITNTKGTRVKKMMNSTENGMASGRRCRKNATISSLKVCFGPIRNSQPVRKLYGKKRNLKKGVLTSKTG
jgi:hypothetical protein